MHYPITCNLVFILVFFIWVTHLTAAIDCSETVLLATFTEPDRDCRGRTNPETNFLLHYWPTSYELGQCHGWTIPDRHDGFTLSKSANFIQCFDDGELSYREYDNNIDCSGEYITKTITNSCTQDVDDDSRYNRILNGEYCFATSESNFNPIVGFPSIGYEVKYSKLNENVYLDGEKCSDDAEDDKKARENMMFVVLVVVVVCFICGLAASS